mgnify:CR=1 FL=1
MKDLGGARGVAVLQSVLVPSAWTPNSQVVRDAGAFKFCVFLGCSGMHHGMSHPERGLPLSRENRSQTYGYAGVRADCTEGRAKNSLFRGV